MSVYSIIQCQFVLSESDLKILLIHLEERVRTHCVDVNVSGHVGATNCSIDAFSRHPHLKKMIVTQSNKCSLHFTIIETCFKVFMCSTVSQLEAG